MNRRISAPVAALPRIALIALCGVALSGCLGGLLSGGGKPAQLYRFGQATTAEPASPTAGTVGVFRSTSQFAREAAGDKILAITASGQAQYIAESRWVSPANVLWDQAVLAAFDAAPGKVRLLSRGERGRADFALRLDVRNFETRYEGGADAAPTVVIRVRATLARDADQNLGPEKMFEAHVPAGSNRVSSIVAAYDRATSQVLGEVVAWTEGQVAATPA